jgi:hypothetical protein
LYVTKRKREGVEERKRVRKEEKVREAKGMVGGPKRGE